MALHIAYFSVLISAVIAIPKNAYQPRFSAGLSTNGLHGTGTIAAPYGQPNSTLAGATGTGHTQIVAVTVVPVASSANVGLEEANPSAFNASPLGGSSEILSQPLINYDGGPKSPNAGTMNIIACGPATVTITEANTVTVTVDAVPESSFPAPAPAVHSESLDFAVKSHTEKRPTRLSDGAIPTAPSLPSVSKHGHHHLKLHHKSAILSVSSNAPSVKPAQSEGASSAAASVAAPNVSTFAESSSAKESSNVPYVAPDNNLAFSTPPEKESSTPTIVAISTPPLIYPVVQSSAPEPESFGPLIASSFSEPESKPSAPPASPAPSAPSVPLVLSTASNPSSPGTKRGLVYNTAALTESFSSSPAISWCYNWDSQPGGTLPPNFNFVPMMWGPLDVHTARWQSNADAAIASGSTHLLGFNEPDLAEQANLTPEEAADAWNMYMEPYAGKAKLGSPAVCNGDSPVGLTWLSRFLETCSSCTIDFIAIHWYGLASDAGVGYFKEHVGKAVQAAQGRPVWITEFKPDGSAEEQASWMEQVLPWLDDQAQSGVERYSFFQVDDILVSEGGSLTDLGTKYAA